MAIREGLWQSKNDHDFILRSLRHGQRVDGRQLGDMRLLRMVLGRSEGQASAEIQLGRTRALGVVTGEVGATPKQADGCLDEVACCDVVVCCWWGRGWWAGKPNGEV